MTYGTNLKGERLNNPFCWGNTKGVRSASEVLFLLFMWLKFLELQ